MNKLAWTALGLTLTWALSGCVLDPTYTFCTSTSECEVDELCAEVTAGGVTGAMCTNECSFDSQCEFNLGFSGACMNTDTGALLCFQECDFPEDCFSSSDCFDYVDPDGVANRVCLPVTL